MRVSELRKLLNSYQEDELRYLVVELYKSVPKTVRKAKELDLLIQAVKENASIVRQDTLDEQPTDLHQLQLEIELFLENVYQQYYIEPNRVIPKQERSKWRYKVKHYVKRLQSIPVESEHGLAVLDLLEKLYELLCLSCIYTLFHTTNPFQSIGVSQEEFLDLILKRGFYYGTNRQSIQKALSLVFQEGMEPEIRQDTLFAVLIRNLNTADAKEIAIEEAICFQEALKKERKAAQAGTAYEDELEEQINRVVECILHLYFSLCEYEEGIAYFKKYYHDGEEDFSIYPLLQRLYDYNKPELWRREYEAARKRNLQLGRNLQECYDKLVARGELPRHY